MVGAYAYGSVAVIEEFVDGHRGDGCSRGPWQRPDRSSGRGDPSGVGRLRLRGAIHRRRNPVLLPGRGLQSEVANRLRGRGTASARDAGSSGPRREPTSSSRPTASRSSSKSTCRPA